MRLMRIGTIILIILGLGIPVISAQPNQNEDVITFKLFSGGMVEVTEHCTADPLDMITCVKAFGTDIIGLKAVDEEGNIIDASIGENEFEFFSLGATEMSISYYTNNLVSFKNDLYELSVTTSAPSIVLLPDMADLVDLNIIPTQMGVIGTHPYLEFEQGEISVHYIEGLPELHQEAASEIKKTKEYIDSRKNIGVVLPGAETLLETSVNFYNSKRYLEATNSAKDALDLAIKINVLAESASQKISEAETEISTLRNGKSEGFDRVYHEIQLARIMYKVGEYKESKVHAAEAIFTAQAMMKTNIFDQTYIMLLSFSGGSMVLAVILPFIGVELDHSFVKRMRGGKA